MLIVSGSEIEPEVGLVGIENDKTSLSISVPERLILTGIFVVVEADLYAATGE